MSYHVEWERLARQAYDQIPSDERLAVADGVMALMHEGIPDRAEPGVDDGAWIVPAGKYLLHFTEHEFTIYLTQIERA
ncbi:hypothetical protein [Actinomadura rupiterrae]|uniref:hypothetical protein n=1 Tax=Actinomadura rupiterrae TaxID=559627 RepID=UPI0020A30BFF|nr:hypothetical protein [Actinomadura rupiterrae]MCP2336879.1 hypothetical protein [Actinomadura rupiterrae]